MRRVFFVLVLAFGLPLIAQSPDPDCKPAGRSFASIRDQILWRLEAAAEIPGIDYSASFELPVFD